MWKKETKEEKFHRIYILGELTLFEQFLEWYGKQILTPIYCFIEAVERVVGWFPVVWKDRDWDADYHLAHSIIYKLKRVIPVLENGHTLSGPKDAKRMRIVTEHFKRYMNIYKYVPQGHIEIDYVDSDYPYTKRAIIKTTKYDRYLNDRADKLEHWHWQEARRIISKYGRGWWD